MVKLNVGSLISLDMIATLTGKDKIAIRAALYQKRIRPVAQEYTGHRPGNLYLLSDVRKSGLLDDAKVPTQKKKRGARRKPRK